MNSHVRPSAHNASTAAAWLKALANYRRPRKLRSALELLVTVVPLIGFSAIAYVSVAYGFWLGLVAIVPASAFLLRMFMIQHDCGHGSFFAHRRLDDWTGRLIGIVTLTPYDYWRRAHATHHASAGNLDERGVGDITTLTVNEYRALASARRLGYCLYRNPLVMFGIGPAWLFIIKQRLPCGMMRSGTMPWLSTMITNLAIAILVGSLVWAVGIAPVLMIQLPMTILAGAAGVWLFYVQHQFEETHWAAGGDWRFPEAALHGASHYDLPPVLRWITGNIGIHHVHHLSSRIPYYRLPEVLRDYPELAGIGRITLLQSLRCVRLVLWDDTRQKLVSFRDAVAG